MLQAFAVPPTLNQYPPLIILWSASKIVFEIIGTQKLSGPPDVIGPTNLIGTHHHYLSVRILQVAESGTFLRLILVSSRIRLLLVTPTHA